MYQLQISLDPNSVASAVLTAAAEAAEVVAFCLNALDTSPLEEPFNLKGTAITYNFRTAAENPEQRRVLYRNWILQKGFQELARGVRTTLEEAFVYLQFVKMPEGSTTWGKFTEAAAKMRKQSRGFKFPVLLKHVNEGLREPISFADEFHSIQRARNCLEHRSGIVSELDVEDGNAALVLRFPRLKIWYSFRGSKIELKPGEMVRGEDDQTEIPIHMGPESQQIEFRVGERIILSATQFSDIAMGCHIFGGELAAKLPRRE
jgi:hypothetical protein